MQWSLQIFNLKEERSQVKKSVATRPANNDYLGSEKRNGKSAATK